MAKKATSKNTKRKAAELRAAIDSFVSNQENNTFNYRQVSHSIGVDDTSSQRTIALYLAELAFDGDLIEVSPVKYKAPQRSSVTTGVFIRRSNGKNSVTTDTDGEVIFVAERNSMHALNGDRVRVNIAARRKGIEPEAEVIEIIEKKDQTFTGTLKVDSTSDTLPPTLNSLPTTSSSQRQNCAEERPATRL